MKLRLLLLPLPLAAALGLAAASSAPAPAPARAAAAWEIDAVHSSVLFRVKHNSAAWAYGRFNQYSGTIEHDPEAPEKSKVEVTIAMDSIDTGNAKRDGHLESPDFFDAKQFPTATFKSTKVEKKGEKLAVTGDLTLRGVTKPLTIEVEPTGSGESRGKKVVGFLGHAKVPRRDFGVSYGPPEALGDEVELILSLEAGQK